MLLSGIESHHYGFMLDCIGGCVGKCDGVAVARKRVREDGFEKFHVLKIAVLSFIEWGSEEGSL